MTTRLQGVPKGVVTLGLGVAGLAAWMLLACGAPSTALVPSSSGVRNGPYFACATATPVSVSALGTPKPGITPLPTETPYYRQGEFYVGQPANFNQFQLAAEVDASLGTWTVVTFTIANHATEGRTLPLSSLAFVEQDQRPVLYDPQGQITLGYPLPEQVEADNLVPSGGVFTETLIFAGAAARVGVLTNNPAFGQMQMGTPIWFLGSADPVGCAHGAADWPVPPPAAGGALGGVAGVTQVPPGYGLAVGSLPAVTNPLALGQYYYRLTVPFGCAPGYVDAHQSTASKCTGAGDPNYPGVVVEGKCAGATVDGVCHAALLGPDKKTLIPIGYHSGIDLAFDSAAFWKQTAVFPVYAVARGVVLDVVNDCPTFCGGAPKASDGTLAPWVKETCSPDNSCGDQYGNHVTISSDVGGGQYVVTRYAHLHAGSIRVSPGQEVDCGTELGEAGNSGNSWGPHLHWETRRNATGTWSGEAEDPVALQELWMATCTGH